MLRRSYRYISCGVWALLTGAVVTFLAVDARFHWHHLEGVPGSAFVSIVISITVVAATAMLWWLQGIRSQRHLAHHMRALESLNQVTAAISAQIGRGPAVLQQIADASRELLGFSSSTIVICESDDLVNVLCASGPMTHTVGMRYSLSQAVLMQRILREDRPIVVENADHSGEHFNREISSRFGIKSFLVVPLRTQGRIMGALFLGSQRARRINESDIRLAELWAAQAGVIALNHRLYDRMRSAVQVQKRLREQRETMLHHSLAIYEDDSLQGALQRMTDEVPQRLGVDLLTVSLLTDRPYELRIMAATTAPLTMNLVGTTMDLRNTPSEACISSGNPVAIADVSTEPRLAAHPDDRLQAGAVLIVPLPGHTGVIGKLTLIRHKPGQWAQETIETARYLGERSAAAIETARLYQQTRADAQTRAMLLRELHHRVKNNLAGIVSLLSINQPELPLPAKHWLDRATERIRIMARAHELFTSARTPLPLPLLMQITLSSLSVLKPPGVKFQTRLARSDIALEADRAVALVMVLHELCHNAIVHGLGDEGTATIDARPDDNGRLVIEVTDDGVPAGVTVAECAGAVATAVDDRPATPSYSNGIGLGLVRGLVMRELHGTFQLRTAASGGTTARIEFPLNLASDSQISGGESELERFE